MLIGVVAYMGGAAFGTAAVFGHSHGLANQFRMPASDGILSPIRCAFYGASSWPVMCGTIGALLSLVLTFNGYQIQIQRFWCTGGQGASILVPLKLPGARG